MEILVETPALKISVRDIEGYCICIRCKGGQCVSRSIYNNPMAWFNGGLIAVWDYVTCPECFGIGFWR